MVLMAKILFNDCSALCTTSSRRCSGCLALTVTVKTSAADDKHLNTACEMNECRTFCAAELQSAIFLWGQVS